VNTREIVRRAFEEGLVIPAFNIPHLPMVEPVARAVAEENALAMIQVARLEWEKFESESLEAVAREYRKYQKPGHTLLHLDHVPVVDEDHLRVDYMAILRRAVDAGYQSLMVDGSRLSLDDNIRATAEAAALAHQAGLPIEAELGAVMGHETSQQAIPYEEIFRNKMGFTDLEEARRFVRETGCDWLSVAVGSVHGAIAEGMLDKKKPAAKLDVGHIQALRDDGMTVLFVEHDMHMVRHISDWVVVMAEGRIVAEGPPDDVMRDQAVIDAYLGAHHDTDLGDDALLSDEVAEQLEAEAAEEDAERAEEATRREDEEGRA